ncbi:MAG: ABC transporter ATP-binding protein [Candidatus Limnocylindrales bacterium]
MSAPGSIAIRTAGLEKRYGDFVAVRSLDLEVRQGEIFGLLGPNGAGKTTTILMLLGLTERTSGTVEVLGRDPGREPLQVKRHVGYLPDNVGFYGSMTGRQNLDFTARLNGIDKGVAASRIDELLDRVGLSDASDSKVETYSRGMKQRLGLADALVKDPSILVLDEPTTSIDPIGVAETLDLVRQLAHEQGVAVLLSSHLLHQVQQVCDRIAIFVSGEVVAMGTLAELATRQDTGVSIRLEVGADGDPTEVDSIIGSVPGVTAIEADEHDARLRVVTGPPDTRQAIARALIHSGHVPWHFRDRGMELSEIYQRYFTGSLVPPSHRRRAVVVPDADDVAVRVGPAERRTVTPPVRRRQIHRSDRRPPSERDTRSPDE